MKKCYCFALAVAAALIFASTDGAQAAPMVQTFNESGVGMFDEIAMFMKTGTASFDGSSGYTASGWTALNSSNYISAFGPDTMTVNFNLGFTDNTVFMFDFFAFNDDNILEAASVSWTERSWKIESMFPLENAAAIYRADLNAVSAPVPEPATMLLMATGIVGLVGAQRKKR